MDDKIDVVALGKGSPKEFDRLFVSFYPRVKSFLRGMLSDENEAEDLAQDTFVRLWQGRERLQEVRNLNAYVYQTVKHILYSYLESRKGCT